MVETIVEEVLLIVIFIEKVYCVVDKNESEYLSLSLIHFMPRFYFYTPWKQKSFGIISVAWNGLVPSVSVAISFLKEMGMWSYEI